MNELMLQTQLGWERRARSLLNRVAAATARPLALGAALQVAVDEVCACTGWPVGHALLARGDEAVSAQIWHLADPVLLAGFRAASEGARFGRGVGLPGRVLEEKRPLWVLDFSAEPAFPRRELAQGLGLHAALAFPVLVQGELHAVLEFLAAQTAEPDEPLLEVLGSIGSLLGRVIERARAQESLRESEQRLRAVAATAHDAIITADQRGRVMTWNRAAQEMFGFSEEEMLGRPLSAIIPARYRGAHEQGMARMQAGGEKRVIGRTVELSGVRKDGAEIPIELSLAQWRVGETLNFTGILRDVSERKAAEGRLHAIAAQLAQSERRAVEASRAKSAFLANMSHELRTPLNAILGFVQLLGRDGTLSRPQREHLEVILRSGEHLLSLINDVLSLSKIEAGSSELREGGFSLRRLALGVVELFRAKAEARGLALEARLGPLPDWVRGDEGKLRQVLLNLLGNAVKFTAAGAITLSVWWQDGRARLSVQDSGPGIAAADAERIFEPFAQAGAAEKAPEGTGLGLAISREFVRRMGGELKLTSLPGQGSLFSLELPLPEASAAEAAPPDLPRVVSLEPGQPEVRILVVENNDDGRTMLVKLLESIGCRVEQAADGREALQVWEGFRPALVWMDMRMPVMDGYQATRAIRAREAELGGPRSVVLALTASAFEHDRPAIHAAGCDGVLLKPFREGALFGELAARLGVRFRFAAQEPAAPLAPSLARVPRALLEELRAALLAGDPVRALERTAPLAQADEGAGQLARGLIEGFRFDELLGLIEGAVP